ncbi:MAG: proton-conducting transporter membrane subunit [Phycisphaerae bacterium]
MEIAFLLSLAFVGALLVYVTGRFSARTRNVLAVLVALVPVVWVAMLYGRSLRVAYYSLPILDATLTLRSNPLAWFFAMAVAVIGLCAIVFSLEYMKGRERLPFYYAAMLLVNGSMLGIVLSGDLISFYIFWEIMSWSTYLVISYRGGRAVAAGLKYIVMSMAGSCAMLLAIASVYVQCGTLEIEAVAEAMQGASAGYALFILLMFAVGFGIKNAVMPLHTWLPDAHSEAVSPFSAVLSGILVRMGMYGFVLIMYGVLGLGLLQRLGSGVLSFGYLFAWLGALTIVIPTFTALLQDDSKRLLAWHGVGQGGYMILGIAVATPLGIAGGIFHTLNHCIYISLLFLVAGAVEHRTGGVRDLNQLGGLAKRMPITFLGGLAGICGLIGVPLTNGFVSKWLIYKTLIAEGYPFLAFAALVGTWGTILSVYKFQHNMFLGQLPERFKDVKEVPLTMQLPMLLLAAAIFVFGIFPGIPLAAIAAIQRSLGLEALRVGALSVPAEVGELNTITVLAAVVGGCVVAYVLFRLCRRSRAVPQADTYGAGSYTPADRYQYSARFYDRAYGLIEPYVRDRVDAFYYWLVEKSEGIFEAAKHVYGGNINTYALYIVLFLALIFAAGWFAWGL